MSWLSSVRKGIQSLTKRQSADNLWHKCKKCGSMVFTKEWEDNHFVCPRCDHHDRVGPTVRFDALFDRKKYEVLPSPEVREDPLKFRDTKRYTDRIKAARSATDERDALINAIVKIEGHQSVVGVQDFARTWTRYSWREEGFAGIEINQTILMGKAEDRPQIPA